MSSDVSGVPAPAFISTQVTREQRFYLNLRPRTQAGLTVVCGGWEQCAPDYVVDRSDFPFLSVEFVAAGRGELVLGGRRQALEPGTLFTYGPGISQRITTDPRERLVKYFVDFSGARGRALLRECRLAPGAVVRVALITEVREGFEQLVRIGRRPGRYAARACALQLELLLLTVASSARSADVRSRRALTTFERCRTHLETNFIALETVEQVAAACHLDIAYMCRLFQRFAGTSPYQYLQRLKMNWAAERLHGSQRLVRQVADELRIDPFQFSRMFKRVHGVSPSEFLRLRG
jgi:AraC-like DNA-binding protein